MGKLVLFILFLIAAGVNAKYNEGGFRRGGWRKKRRRLGRHPGRIASGTRDLEPTIYKMKKKLAGPSSETIPPKQVEKPVSRPREPEELVEAIEIRPEEVVPVETVLRSLDQQERDAKTVSPPPLPERESVAVKVETPGSTTTHLASAEPEADTKDAALELEVESATIETSTPESLEFAAKPLALSSDAAVPAIDESLLSPGERAVRTIFAPELSSLESGEIFEKEWKERCIEWEVELQRIEDFGYDSRLGSGPATRIVGRVASFEGRFGSHVEVDLISRIDDATILEGMSVGQRVVMCGRIFDCDLYMQRIYLAELSLKPQ